jgi:hypothetical protein
MKKLECDRPWQRVTLWLVMLTVLLIGFVLTSYPTTTRDVYWHLSLGREIIENYNFPRVDDFSFTFQGQNLKTFPYIFDSILFSLVKFFGFSKGTWIYLFGSYSSVILLTAWYLRRLKASVILSIAVIFGLALFLNFRILLRPELLAYTFIVAAFILYGRAKKAFSTESILLIALLLLIWTNYHSVVFGYIVFFGLYIDVAITNFREKTWSRGEVRKWCLSGFLLVLVGFINPFGNHGVLSVMNLGEEWTLYIKEYENIFFILSEPFSRPLLAFWLAIMIVLGVRQKQYGYLLVLTIFAIGAIKYSRLLVPAGIVLFLIVADFMSRSEKENKGGSTKATALLSIGFLVSTFFWYGYWVVNYKAPAMVWPENLVTYFKEKGYGGKILNEYDIGGYLIYSLYPDARVYIDGRTDILYDLSHFRKNFQLFSDINTMKVESQKYDIDFVISSNKADINDVIYGVGRYSLDYMDDAYSLYTERSGNFILGGFLISQPACWDGSSLTLLVNEYNKAIEIDGLSKVFIDYLGIIIEFEDAEQKGDYIDSKIAEDYSVINKRFLAYQALRLEKLDVAELLFSSIDYKSMRDYLALADVLIRDQKYKEAKDLLTMLVKSKELYTTEQDRYLFYVITNLLAVRVDLGADLAESVGILGHYFHENKRSNYNTTPLAFKMYCNQERLESVREMISMSGLKF